MKKFIAFLVILTIILSIFSISAIAVDVNFIAINDKLLSLDSMPYFFGSAYVPIDVFTQFNDDGIGFHVNLTYFQSGNTYSLYTSEKQLYYSVSDGTVYDHEDVRYYTPTILRNGELFVSVQFVSQFFGLSWSRIQGSGYGDVVRITDGNQFLSDSDFLAAAESLMKSRYESYMSTIPTPTPAPTATPTPSAEPEEDEEEEEEGGTLYLTFEGAPSENLINLLDTYSIKASFYLTADEIAENADLVRKIVGNGHVLGVLCTENPEEEFALTSEIMYDACAFFPLIVSSYGENLITTNEFASEFGYKFNSYDIYAGSKLDSNINSNRILEQIEDADEPVKLRLGAGNEYVSFLNSLLYYLRNNEYEFLLEREI